MIDFDHNATTVLDSRVAEVMVQTLRRTDLGNPSSVHARGRAARDVVETARRAVAAAVGAEPLEVTFTGSGTEANSLALAGVVRALRRKDRPHGLLTSRLEHAAITTAAAALAGDGVPVHWIQPDEQGRIPPAAVAQALTQAPDVGLVSLMSANHELGNRYEVPGIVAAVREVRNDVLVHTDAVQALGKCEVDFAGWGVDLLSISAHKIHGPTGAGALVHRRHLTVEAAQFGHQERGRRGGTEATAVLAGFGLAATLARAEQAQRHARSHALRQRLLEGLESVGGHVIGDRQSHIGNTINVGFEGCDGELVCMNLDLEGVAVSTGSACSAGSIEPSTIVTALGVSQQRARQSVRFSLGPDNTEAEIDDVLRILPPVLERIRAAARRGAVVS
jgi:cysteine desulfurase